MKDASFFKEFLIVDFDLSFDILDSFEDKNSLLLFSIFCSEEKSENDFILLELIFLRELKYDFLFFYEEVK